MTTRLFFLIWVVSSFSLCITAQSYPKEKNAIRILTYNTHYCKGATDPGKVTEENTRRFAEIVKSIDADIVALQELDSASKGRKYRYLLKEIGDYSGIDYVPYYGNAAPFDRGSIGCGVLVRKGLPVKSVEIIHLPGDETRAAVKITFNNFVFIGTHLDLNNELRKESARILTKAAAKEKLPVFLAGDLNDSHRWSNGGIAFPIFTESFTIINDTIGLTIPRRDDYGAFIDYVLQYKNKKASKVKVVQTKIVRAIDVDNKSVDTGDISDHYPVFVDIKLK